MTGTATAQEVSSLVEHLIQRVQTLEERVCVLERGQQAPVSHTEIPLSNQGGTPAAEAAAAYPAVELPAGLVPTIGKAVLGMAGAYFLRAIAESGAVPQLPVLLAAIVYAMAWMWFAIRKHKDSFASITYGITSTLILAPMLVEATVRFQILTPAQTVGILFGYFLLTVALSWRSELQLLPAVALLAIEATCFALFVTTHALVPITAAILAFAACVEFSTCLGHLRALRAISAIGADLAVPLTLFVLTNSTGIPEGYAAPSALGLVALWLALIAVYTLSIGVRGFVHLEQIGWVDIIQGALAFGVGVYGMTRTPQGSLSMTLGVLLMAVSVGCYWGALSRFADPAYTRNRRVSAGWAGVLLFSGCWLLPSPNVRITLLCFAAIGATFLYRRTGNLSIGIHPSFYLIASAAVSSMPRYEEDALAGPVPSQPAWTIVFIAATAAICYWMGSRSNDRRVQRVLWIAPVALVGFAIAAIAVTLIARFSAGRIEMMPSRLSVVRTIVICAIALNFGLTGLYWKREELGWLAYAAVVVGTLKLIFEDLRFGNPASLVISLLFYGMTLIALPRLMSKAGTEVAER